MKIIIQRVLKACVKIEDDIIGEIENGLLLYVCLEVDDTIETVKSSVYKISQLRIFEDSDHRMNRDILQTKGKILSISQFTLSWDGTKGHRPSFDKAMNPNEAKILYRHFNDQLELKGIEVEKGHFGADMKVESINDGPVSFFLQF